MTVSSQGTPTSQATPTIEAETGRSGDRRRRLPGDGHMWVLVLGEFVIFGSYLVVYMIDRASTPEAYTAAQRHLDVGLGAFNTVVLLTSSLLMALAVIATKHGDPKGAERRIIGAGACGLLFIFVKAYEWHREAQYFSIHNEFLSHYYVLTGIHVFHLVVGLLVLGVLVRELRDPRKQRLGTIEQGALYWHMVDVIWVVIFAVLYLMR